MRRMVGWLLLTLWWAPAPGAAGAARPPERFLAADTVAFVAVPDWAAASAAWRSNALGQFWADPAMRPFREKFQSRFTTEVIGPLQQELGLDLAALSGLIQGQITLAITATSPDGLPAKNTGFLLLADAGNASNALSTNLAAWRKKWVDSGRPIKSLTIRQTEFTLLSLSLNEVSGALDKVLPSLEPGGPAEPAVRRKPVTVDWTIGQVGGLLVVSDSAREVDKLMAQLGTNPPPALAEAKIFSADAALLKEAQLYAWLSGKAILDQLAPVPPSDPAGAPEGHEALSFGQLAQGLGLVGLQSATLALRGTPDGTRLTLHLRIPEATRSGLFKVATILPKDSSPPPLVPDDVIKFSRLRLDLAGSWAHFESMLAEASPPAASFLRFIVSTAGKDKDEKFDLRQQLIAKLGDDLVAWEKLPQRTKPVAGDAPGSLILVGARNPDQVFDALPALTGLLPPEVTKARETDILGRKVRSVTLPRTQPDGSLVPGPAWSYVAVGNYLAFCGDSALLREYLRNADTAPHPLRERPGFMVAAQNAGGLNTGCLSYENAAESARLFFEAAGRESFNAAALLRGLQLGNTLGLGQGTDIMSWCDFSLLPPYERVAKYFHINVSTLSPGPEGFTYRYFAPTPPSLTR
jgi:hypothetical protein